MRFEDKEASSAVMNLLHGLSIAQVRALGVEALRRWRSKPLPHGSKTRDPVEQPTRDVFSLHGDFGVEFVQLLAANKLHRNPDTHKLKEVFIDDASLHTEWMAPVAEFLWWLVRAGLAVEVVFGRKTSITDSNENERWYPSALRLTARGAAFLDSAEDNPLLPGFLDRVRDRCPNLPDGVVALLVDARACLDHSLLRPAVVLMGVAYELAIEEVVAALVTKGLLHTNSPGQLPAERIRRIRELIQQVDRVKIVLPTTDARTAAASAYEFADVLRLRRNEAAHTRPAYDFEHAGETEEFLVSAGRHLPALWSLALA